MEGSVGNAWWEKVASGGPADERINHQTGIKEQRGDLNDSLLAMVSQPGRVDWTLQATEEGSPERLELPTVGPMSDSTLEPFMEIVKKWLDECPPVSRLAFGVILGRLAADARTGYEKIQYYLPCVELSPQDATDFFYQINRPTESTVRPDTKINRISKWSVPIVGNVGVTIDTTASTASASMQGQYICRLELDINTAPLDHVFSGNDAYAVFEELAAHGLEIASRGDIP